MNELTQECLSHLQKEINKLKEEMEVLKKANKQSNKLLINSSHRSPYEPRKFVSSTSFMDSNPRSPYEPRKSVWHT